MSSFRGIGDAATPVKMQQDQMAQQAALEANRLNQQAQQFEETKDMQKENTAWARSQAEKADAENTRRFDIADERANKALAEDSRRFNIGDQRASRGELAGLRGEGRAERQLTMEEVRNTLAARRDTQQAAQGEIQTKAAQAQLDHYLAIAAQDKKAREDREKLAKGAFAGMLFAARDNGGIVPVSALEQANRELGDKDNRIIGGWLDDTTGLATWEVLNIPTGQKTKKNLTPDKQYAMIYGGTSKDEADMWYGMYKVGSAERAAMDRERIGLGLRVEADKAKQENRAAIRAEDPKTKLSLIKENLDLAKAYRDRLKEPGLGDTPEQKDEWQKSASEYEAQAERLRKEGQPQQAQVKPFALTPEMAAKRKIPSIARPKPNPDGSYSMIWQIGNDVYKEKFAPGEW
jgi:hypothetical protein